MRKFFALAILFGFTFFPAIAATLPGQGPTETPGKRFPDDGLRKKIISLKIKDLQRITGRKFSLKEKIVFFVLKKKLRQKPNTSSSLGQTALIFGVAAATLFVIGLFVPYVIIASLIAAIVAIVTGSSATKRDRSDRKAHGGKLLGWITIGLILFLVLLAAIIVASWV